MFLKQFDYLIVSPPFHSSGFSHSRYLSLLFSVSSPTFRLFAWSGRFAYDREAAFKRGIDRTSCCFRKQNWLYRCLLVSRWQHRNVRLRRILNDQLDMSTMVVVALFARLAGCLHSVRLENVSLFVLITPIVLRVFKSCWCSFHF